MGDLQAILLRAVSLCPKIKRIDLQPQVTVTTVPIAIAPPLREPSGVAVADGRLYVADTNNHRIVVWNLQGQGSARTLEIQALGRSRSRRSAARSESNSRAIESSSACR